VPDKAKTAPRANRAENMSTGGATADLPLYDKTGKPAFAHPHYWASFVLIGNWR
jgi:CHAT domain-containing protein